MTHHFFKYQKHRVVAFCVLLGFSELLVAGTRDPQSNSNEDPPIADTSNSAKAAAGYAAAEEAMRIRRDLEEYSRTVDPAHVQIEERRRVMHQRIQERFSEIDKDNDGSISRIEAFESLPQVARHFNSVDTNGDNLISLDELEALQARIYERQRALAVRVEAPDPEPETSKHKSKDVQSKRKHTL